MVLFSVKMTFVEQIATINLVHVNMNIDVAGSGEAAIMSIRCTLRQDDAVLRIDVLRGGANIVYCVFYEKPCLCGDNLAM